MDEKTLRALEWHLSSVQADCCGICADRVAVLLAAIRKMQGGEREITQPRKASKRENRVAA